MDGYSEAVAVLMEEGLRHHQARQLGEAERSYRTAALLQPGNAAVHHRLGQVLMGAGRAVGAEACFRAALRLAPDAAGAWNDFGVLLCEFGRLRESEAALREALRLRPGHADSESNLGNTLLAGRRLGEAEACYCAVLTREPGHADARYNLGTLHLLQGRLIEGWEGFEWRWRRRGYTPPRAFAQSRWDGRPTDSVLLLHAEQGFGDSIQMARFVPALAAAGPVVLEVPAELIRLFAGLGARLVATGEALPPFDVHCPLPSLPHALGLEAIPPAGPYLHPPAAAVAAWRERMRGLAPLRVGLAWAGNPRHTADVHRSIPPGRLGGLADIPGVAFVSLQPHCVAPAVKLHDWSGEWRDFADTAALVAALDLVISVDTAVAHLAGALSRPVWLLNRFDGCWRWLAEGEGSTWYPTLRQFRQPSCGDWESVLAAVRTALNG